MLTEPSLVSQKIINKKSGCNSCKKVSTLNKPAYVGMCILHLNRSLMYDLHYHYVKNRYCKKVRLLIETNDVYKFFIHKQRYV